MHQSLIKARAAEADKARQEQLAAARRAADRERCEEAADHVVATLEDAFGGILVRSGKNVGRLYAHRMPIRNDDKRILVKLAMNCGPNPDRHPGISCAIQPFINQAGNVEYEHYCVRSSMGAGKVHNLEGVVACVAEDVAKAMVDDPDPPTKVALTESERHRLGALLRASGEAADATLANRLDPPAPCKDGRAGRNIELTEGEA